MAEPMFLDKQEEQWRLLDETTVPPPPAGERTRCQRGRRDGRLWRTALRRGLAVLAVFGIFGLLVRSLKCREVRGVVPPASFFPPPHHSHPGLDSCGGPDRYTLLSDTYSVEAGPARNITIVQKTARHLPESGRRRTPKVRGTFDVRVSSSPRVTLDVVLSDKTIPVSVTFDQEQQRLTVTTPVVLPPWEGPHEPCIEVRAVVFLPPGSELGALSLRAVSLAVSLEEALGLKAGEVSVETVQRGVTLGEGALVGAGSVSLRSVAGDIDAEVPATEVVRAETTSGTISLRLVPAADDNPGRPQTTCSVTVSTVSGRVDVREEKELPSTLRYSHSVRSVSGDIHVALPFTTESSITSTSGGITAALAPVFGDGEPREGSLRTKTVSGKADVTVSEPRGGGALDELASRHEGTSRAQRLRYPRAWEGRFTARSVVGRVDVEGKDVRVRKGRRGGVEGEKGEGGSRLEVTSLSGDIEVVIGDV